ncbi:hypothetical protein V2J09_020134 [Rumex salicifolius]
MAPEQIDNKVIMGVPLQCERRKLTPKRVMEKGKRKVVDDDELDDYAEGELEDDLEVAETSDDEYDSVHSDNSIECDYQIVEELNYDGDELVMIREMNQNLRKEQKNQMGPSAGAESYEYGGNQGSHSPMVDLIDDIHTMCQQSNGHHF